MSWLSGTPDDAFCADPVGRAADLDDELARLEGNFRRSEGLGADEGEVGGRNAERDRAALARRERDLLKAFQLAHRPRAAGDRIADVELLDLFAGDRAGVAHGDAGGERHAVAAQFIAIDFNVTVVEPREAQPVAERIERCRCALDAAGSGELAEHRTPMRVAFG